jgi:hypothetical protein
MALLLSKEYLCRNITFFSMLPTQFIPDFFVAESVISLEWILYIGLLSVLAWRGEISLVAPKSLYIAAGLGIKKISFPFLSTIPHIIRGCFLPRVRAPFRWCSEEHALMCWEGRFKLSRVFISMSGILWFAEHYFLGDWGSRLCCRPRVWWGTRWRRRRSVGPVGTPHCSTLPRSSPLGKLEFFPVE